MKASTRRPAASSRRQKIRLLYHSRAFTGFGGNFTDIYRQPGSGVTGRARGFGAHKGKDRRLVEMVGVVDGRYRQSWSAMSAVRRQVGYHNRK